MAEKGRSKGPQRRSAKDSPYAGPATCLRCNQEFHTPGSLIFRGGCQKQERAGCRYPSRSPAAPGYVGARERGVSDETADGDLPGGSSASALESPPAGIQPWGERSLVWDCRQTSRPASSWPWPSAGARQPPAGSGPTPRWTAGGSSRLCRPGVAVVQPMVGLGEHRGQPQHAHPPQAQTDPVPVGGQVLVQQLLEPHLLQLGQQQGNVIDTFCEKAHAFGPGQSSRRLAPRLPLPHCPSRRAPAVGSSGISAGESLRPYHNCWNSSKFERTVSYHFGSVRYYTGINRCILHSRRLGTTSPPAVARDLERPKEILLKTLAEEEGVFPSVSLSTNAR